jgi:hypothetical protein
MLKLTAIKTKDYIVEGRNYLIGGMITTTKKVVCMDETATIKIPGQYNSEEIFGLTADEVYNRIVNNS